MFNEQDTRDWWAEGDTPVRNDSRVTYLVDGRAAMLTMCRHFLTARKYTYLPNWGLTPGIELVRGTDHQAGRDGSPEEETFNVGMMLCNVIDWGIVSSYLSIRFLRRLKVQLLCR